MLPKKNSDSQRQGPPCQYPYQCPHGAGLCGLLDAGKVQGWYRECAHCHGPLFSLCAGLPHQGPKGSNSSQGLVEEFLLPVWVPARLHADQGRNFESAIVKELCKCTGITKTHTTPYHPQGNGTTERFNRTLMNMLGTLEPHLKPQWHEYVDAMTHAYNCLQHDSTGYSPYYLMFGRHPRLPVDLIFGSPKTDQLCEYSEYVQTLYDSLTQAYALANQTSQLAKGQQKKYYDKRAKSEDFSPGDRVLVKVCHVEGKQKLRDRWEARPYVVVRKQPGLPVYVVRPEDGGAERVRG